MNIFNKKFSCFKSDNASSAVILAMVLVMLFPTGCNGDARDPQAQGGQSANVGTPGATPSSNGNPPPNRPGFRTSANAPTVTAPRPVLPPPPPKPVLVPPPPPPKPVLVPPPPPPKPFVPPPPPPPPKPVVPPPPPPKPFVPPPPPPVVIKHDENSVFSLAEGYMNGTATIAALDIPFHTLDAATLGKLAQKQNGKDNFLSYLTNGVALPETLAMLKSLLDTISVNTKYELLRSTDWLSVLDGPRNPAEKAADLLAMKDYLLKEYPFPLYKFTKKFFEQPKDLVFPPKIPPPPSCKDFSDFVRKIEPNFAIKFRSIGGAAGNNAVERLCLVLDPINYSSTLSTANISPQVAKTVHEQLSLVYEALVNQKDPSRVKTVLLDLLDRSKACLVALSLAVEEALTRLLVGDTTMADQLKNFALVFKDEALKEYIEKNHPSSIDPKVLSNPGMATEQYPHVYNTYIAKLGKELGFRAATIRTAKQDRHRNPKYKVLIKAKPKIILQEIIDHIELGELVMGSPFTTGLMNDINYATMNNQIETKFNNFGPKVVLPNPTSFIDATKASGWIWALEGGAKFDGVNYSNITTTLKVKSDYFDDYNERFEFSQLSAGEQKMLTELYGLGSLSTSPYDVQGAAKKAALFTPKTVIELLWVEGLIEKR